ncbi:Chorismate dehydratase [Pseudodesulfovibrio profundus]|uniref:Chorismate dehydratase n=1 Tax=Pseudodesulfovibrio profundus TaxID=57320 RepID=A0A2C8FGF6_9BACT|nr:menaquinone biosynthesis protein [Pseudodesulfovibrio profundus]SOB60911.1 Chorismate dehydratase [Pseudodesulfovibrio profundus]
MSLRLGKISYLNVLPIYRPIENGLIDHDFEIVSGPPSELNKLMDAGELDISAASSIEYARHPEKYLLVPNIAIGSRGPVQSVLLLSKYPVEELENKTILVSSQTHTSAALLKVLLAELWKVSPDFVTGDATSQLESGNEFDAILAIGDEALNLRYHPSFPHRVDLGESWRELTGLPFIFGVWIAQRSSFEENPSATVEGCKKLVEARLWGEENIRDICLLASESSCLNQTEMCSYFDGLVYEFGEQELKGLTEFCRYLKRNGLLEKIPPMDFLSL